MESSPSPQKSRSQPRYNLSTSSTQPLKNMATTTTTTASAAAPASPRTKSQQQQQPYLQDNSSTTNSPISSSSSSSSGGSSKKRPLPKESSSKNNSSNTTSDIQSKVIVTTPTQSAATTTTALRILSRSTLDISQVTHDAKNYMFKLRLDAKGNIAALCYLPTRYATLVEFYHTEVPLAYRHLGIGDLLVRRAFEWVEQSNLLVIPSCPFVLRYLKTHYPDKNGGQWKYTVDDELDGLETLVHRI